MPESNASATLTDFEYGLGCFLAYRKDLLPTELLPIEDPACHLSRFGIKVTPIETSEATDLLHESYSDCQRATMCDKTNS
jgi:hypothetical protein